MTVDGLTQLAAPGTKMKICAFLWTYYGYPNSNYEGVSVKKEPETGSFFVGSAGGKRIDRKRR